MLQSSSIRPHFVVGGSNGGNNANQMNRPRNLAGREAAEFDYGGEDDDDDEDDDDEEEEESEDYDPEQNHEPLNMAATR